MGENPNESDSPLSQEDIDAAMAAASDGSSEEPTIPADSDSPLSQADIDAALAGADGDAGGGQAAVDDRVDSTGRPFDEAAAAMAAAIEEEKAAAKSAPPAEPPPLPDGAVQAEMPDFDLVDEKRTARGIDLLSDVDLHVKIELGRTRMLVNDVLELGPGSVVELDRHAGDPVDVYVNERLVARGEVLVLSDNFCVRINEILRNTSPPNLT